MTEAEYRVFLRYLFEHYIRPRLRRMRRSHGYEKFGEPYSHLVEQAVSAARVFRFNENDYQDDSDIFATFTAERLKSAVEDAQNSTMWSYRGAEEAGFLDAFRDHGHEITAGLSASHLPETDKQIIREIGTADPDLEIEGLVHVAKAELERRQREGLTLEVFEQDFQSAKEAVQKRGDVQMPKKKIRWFKGLGQVSTGAAFSLANLALAVGTLNLPVSAETQTWGAFTSVLTGLGTILNGIGELRGE
jgi:hypothetical protein